jgi:hypothetical protein
MSPVRAVADPSEARALSRLLANVLLCEAAAAGDSAAVLGRAARWPAAVELASLWRVLPRLRARVARLGLAVPPDAASRLRELGAGAAAQSIQVAHGGARVLASLTRAGIAAIAFKGIGLVGNLYRSPAERMVMDVDVLIEPDDLLRAREALGAAGFAPVFPATLGDYLSFLRHRPHAENGYLELADPDGLEIDLHWSLGTTPAPELTAGRLIARAQPAQLYGCAIRVAAPEDAILLTVHHSLRNHLMPQTTVKDLCDLAAWWELAARSWEPDRLVERAFASGLGVPLLAAWHILAEFDPQSPAATAGRAVAAASPEAVRGQALALAGAFFFQLRKGALNLDLLRALRPSSLGRFVLSRTSRRATYERFVARLRHTRGLPVIPFLHRLRRVGIDMAHLEPGGFASYRAVVRAQKVYASAHRLRPAASKPGRS